MQEQVDPPEDSIRATPETTDSNAKERRSRWWIALALIGAVIAATWYFVQVGAEQADTPDAVARTFREVVRRDLVEQTTYDGTLGRSAGDSLVAGEMGTVTWLPAEGVTLVQGDVVFELDAQPVVLLYGETPIYRVLSRSAEDRSVVSRLAGTVTALPEVGAVIEQGDVIYEVDGKPVVALYGVAPAYRSMADLGTNMTGSDVQQLEEALDALGFVAEGELTIDDEFTSATASVVERWQEAVGSDEDGVVDLGEVIFIPGPTEVSSVFFSIGDAINAGQPVLSLSDSAPMVGDDVTQLEAALFALGFDAGGDLTVDSEFTSSTSVAVKAFEEAYGLTVDGRLTPGEVLFVDAAVRVAGRLTPLGGAVNSGTPILAVTGERTFVTMNLPAADQGTVTEGMAVSVELPDGTDVPATVISVATIATVDGNETVFEVEVELDDPAAAEGLDEAPVDVSVVTDSVEDVVAVPVAALLALAEGGYAVEVDAGGGATRLVAVEPGFFADGLVEVSGELEPGDRVVVP